MLIKTDGLVLKTVNYSNTSVISTIYTRELGLKTYMFKGIRNTRGKKGNIVQPMTFLEMVANEQNNKNIQYLKEYKPKFVYQSLPYDIRKSAIGLFILEVIQITIQEEEKNTALFDFLLNKYLLLDTTEESFSQFHLTFMYELTEMLGFQPYNNYDEATNKVFALPDGFFVPQEDGYLNTLREDESFLFHRFIASQGTEPLDKTQRTLLLDIFERYLQAHILNFRGFKTPAIFESIFK